MSTETLNINFRFQLWLNLIRTSWNSPNDNKIILKPDGYLEEVSMEKRDGVKPPFYVLKIHRYLRWAIKGNLIESIRVNREESIRNADMVGIVIDNNPKL